jgi:spermidine synthase
VIPGRRDVLISRAARVAPLVFGSGLCALVYQVAWLREFRLVFGASTAASAAVLAIFIGGLGIGSLRLGRRADRHPRPLQFYAQLETIIASSAAVTPALLWLVRQAYIRAGGTLAMGLAGGSLVRLVLATLVLAVPTFAMGGTLPAVARAIEIEDAGRRRVALLYGVNTLGAVVGSLLATFLLLETYGTRRTLWLACLLNLLVAVVARSIARGLTPEGDTPSTPEEPAERVAPPAFVLAGAAVSGFAFFLMELVWYRMLGPLLGGSVFTFGLILAVALLGIGIGGAAYSLLSGGRPATLQGFALTCLAEAACIAAPYALGDRVAILAFVLRPLGAMALLWGHVVGWAAICFLVVLPPSLVAGFQFPLLIALLGRGRRQLGTHVGLAYAWNTLGAIVGSLAGGFGLIPLLSAPGAWQAAASALAALGLVAAGLSARHRGSSGPLLLPAGLAALVLLLLGATGPTAAWRHGGIGAGRGPSLFSSPNALRDWLRLRRGAVVWEADGIESSVALEGVDGFSLVINGKIDGNTRADASTMVMSGLLGALLHPEPRRSLVIGLGLGETAGWLGVVPAMERTDVVELEPRVLDVARDCAPANQNVMANPRVHITTGDAREALLVSRERYDVIFSEPSNPYRAGVASLFTREYYQAVAERLADGGLFLQWVQAYEIDAQTMQTIYATLASVFPMVETWQVGSSDILLLASQHAVTYDATALRTRLEQEPFRTAIPATWRVTDLEGVLSFFVAGPSLTRAIADRHGAGLNTDDRNSVEFAFARTVGRGGLFSVNDLRDTARARDDDRPRVRGEVDWDRVQDDRLRLYPQAAAAPIMQSEFTPGRRALAWAFEHFDARDLPGVLRAWRMVGREPRNLSELALVTTALADAGDDAALPYIEQWRAFDGAEADCILGRLRARQGRLEEAAAALESAFKRCREDPWASAVVVREALTLAREVADRRPALSLPLFEAVRAPFVVRCSNHDRLNAMAELLSHVDLKTHCRDALKPLEPYITWNRNWLTLRRDCYVATHDPGARLAARDLEEFLSREPVRFGAALGTRQPN